MCPQGGTAHWTRTGLRPRTMRRLGNRGFRAVQHPYNVDKVRFASGDARFGRFTQDGDALPRERQLVQPDA
jgi:hypothetical protein